MRPGLAVLNFLTGVSATSALLLDVFGHPFSRPGAWVPLDRSAHDAFSSPGLLPEFRLIGPRTGPACRESAGVRALCLLADGVQGEV